MNDDSAPGMEVGFQIDFANSFAQLAQLDSTIDTVKDAAVGQFGQIEAAAKGMNLAGPSAEVKTFGVESTRAAQQFTANAKQIERAGEATIRQIERQNDSYGKTKSEMRSLRVEELARNATLAGNIDLANRLRAVEQVRWEQEFAGARAARIEADNLAEAKTRAAMAAEAEAQRVREAAQAHSLFEARAREGAQALREHETQAARDFTAMQRLRELLDPAAAAQARLNHELSEARRLLTAAGASAEQLSQAELILTQHHGSVVRSQGAVRAGAMQLSQNLNDVAVQYQMQTPLMTIFAQQSGQLVGALSLMTGETKGFLGLLAGPWGLGITTAITLLAPFVAKLWAGSEASKAHEEAMKAQKKALDDLDSATGRGNRTLEQRISLGVAATKVALQQAQATRDQTKADLERALATAKINANMNTGIGSEGDGSAAIGATINSIQVERLTKLLGENNKAVAENEQRLRAAGRPALMAQIVAMTDKNAAATKKLTDQQTLLNQAYDVGRIGDAEFVTQGLALQRQIDKIADSDKAATAAKREHNKEVREQVRLQKELSSTYDTMLAVADPDLAALKQYKAELADIAKIAKAFNFDTGTVDQFVAAYREKMMKARGQIVDLQLPDLSIDIDTSKLTQNLDGVLGDVRTLRDELIAIPETFGPALADFANAWGNVGRGIESALTSLGGYFDQQQQLEEQHRKSIETAKDAGVIERANSAFAAKSAINQMSLYGDLTTSAKSFFKEGSTGFKVLGTAEKAFRLAEFALSAQSVVVKAAETAAKLPLFQAQTTAAAATGAANMFATLGPAGFAAVAAMTAVLAAFGFSGAFGGGGGSKPVYNNGTGTVFGDTDAKSDSIKRSLDLLADLDTEGLIYSRQMAASLKVIESQIGGVTNLVLRNGLDNVEAKLGVNTGFNSSLPGFVANPTAMGAAIGGIIAGPIGAAVGALASKLPVIGDILGGISSIVHSLFGTKTTVVGSGVFGTPQTLGAIESLGFSGQTFADIKKKKKFFGVSTSTKYSTQYGDLDDGIANQFGLLLSSFGDAIKIAAGPLGVDLDTIEAKLNTFVVDIGRIDLKDLTGDEIQEKLAAVFGAQADLMAQYAIPGMERFQQVGEGAFETLVRVASTVDVVTSSLQLMGLSAKSLGVDASMAITGFFDSVADYQSATDAYFSTFYSEQEQAAAKAAQLGKVFNSLGIAMPDSIATYRQLVEAQDLTSEAGQQLYAQLLQLAPAFAQTITAGSGQQATTAAAILRERADLEKQLMQAQGDTAGLRALELAQLDPSNRALQQRIYALTDEAAATQKATGIANERAGLERQLLELNGDTSAIRQLDLAKLDESNRALQILIWTRQEEIATTQAAAQAAQDEANRQASIAQERTGLERQILELQGNTAELRQRELAALDPANRALQQQIYLLQDAQEAAKAAKELADAWSAVGDSIMDEVKRIRGAEGANAMGYDVLQRQFNSTTAAARAGNQDAAKLLPELSKSLLAAAADSEADGLMIRRISAVTAASLEQTYAIIKSMTGSPAPSSAPTSSVDQQAWYQNFLAAQAAAPSNAPANDAAAEMRALRAEVAQMRQENNSGNARLIGEMAKVNDVLDEAAAEGEGALGVKLVA